MHANDIIEFWFETIEPKKWWIKDETFDQLLNEEFGSLHQQAVKGELFSWRCSAHGRLAEIIILDQFSRNIYRNDPRSFAYDSMALVLAQEAINNNTHEQLKDKEKSFLYMPFMHSESLVIHQQAIKLFSEPGLEGNTEFEKRHPAIIELFGQ